jgi:spore coat protein U-like protein
MHIPKLKSALTALLLGSASTFAQAQVCTFSSTGVNFGNLELNNVNNARATGTVTASCTGTQNATITICPNIGCGTGGCGPNGDPRYLTQGADKVEYNLFQTNGVGQIWGSHAWPFTPRPPTMSVTLNGGGSGNTQATVFGRVTRTNVPSGTYTSSFSGIHTLFDYGYAPQFTCGPTASSRAIRVPFSVQVGNTSQCTISASSLDFGALTNLNTQVDATNSISIRCNTGVRYSIGLSNGTSGASAPSLRQMKSALSQDSISYGIYTNQARTAVWGTANTAVVSGTGNGNTQNFTGYGRIPAQTTPAPSDYRDTVVITVTY